MEPMLKKSWWWFLMFHLFPSNLQTVCFGMCRVRALFWKAKVCHPDRWIKRSSKEENVLQLQISMTNIPFFGVWGALKAARRCDRQIYVYKKYRSTHMAVNCFGWFFQKKLVTNAVQSHLGMAQNVWYPKKNKRFVEIQPRYLEWQCASTPVTSCAILQITTSCPFSWSIHSNKFPPKQASVTWAKEIIINGLRQVSTETKDEKKPENKRQYQDSVSICIYKKYLLSSILRIGYNVEATSVLISFQKS